MWLDENTKTDNLDSAEHTNGQRGGKLKLSSLSQTSTEEEELHHAYDADFKAFLVVARNCRS